jgi:hypothetical protein
MDRRLERARLFTEVAALGGIGIARVVALAAGFRGIVAVFRPGDSFHRRFVGTLRGYRNILLWGTDS